MGLPFNVNGNRRQLPWQVFIFFNSKAKTVFNCKAYTLSLKTRII